MTVWDGYASGAHPPGIKDPLGSTFKVAHTILKAHSQAYHTYNQLFRPQQKGMIFSINILMLILKSQKKT